jgi:hypothetical protein
MLAKTCFLMGVRANQYIFVGNVVSKTRTGKRGEKWNVTDASNGIRWELGDVLEYRAGSFRTSSSPHVLRPLALQQRQEISNILLAAAVRKGGGVCVAVGE